MTRDKIEVLLKEAFAEGVCLGANCHDMSYYGGFAAVVDSGWKDVREELIAKTPQEATSKPIEAAIGAYKYALLHRPADEAVAKDALFAAIEAEVEDAWQRGRDGEGIEP